MSSANGLPAIDRGLALAVMVDLDHPTKTKAAEFARHELSPDDMVDRDERSTFFREGWERCAEFGIQGMVVPEIYGGEPADLITTMLTLEGLGLGSVDNGLGFALASQMLSFQDALVRFGDDEQRHRILPGVCQGTTIGAFAITEPDSGSDTYSMSMTASLDGDHYVLDGHKSYITLSPVADLAIVFASTKPEVGRWGITAFLVESDRDGAVFTENRPKMGLRTTPFGDIVLEGCRVPVGNRLGPEGAGASIFATAMESERGLIFATQLGAMERLIDRSTDYARERRQFDQRIGDFQAVSHRIADMKVRHETSRLLLYKAAVLLASGENVTMGAAMSKLHASESLASVALDMARTFGAKGYLPEFEVEREVRDALGSLVYSGTSDIQRNIIARLLGVSR